MAIYINYTQLQDRLDSFKIKNSIFEGKNIIFTLSTCGFFYLEFKDYISCFNCGLIIYDFIMESNKVVRPFQEHIKRRENCDYINKFKIKISESYDLIAKELKFSIPLEINNWFFDKFIKFKNENKNLKFYKKFIDLKLERNKDEQEWLIWIKTEFVKFYIEEHENLNLNDINQIINLLEDNRILNLNEYYKKIPNILMKHENTNDSKLININENERTILLECKVCLENLIKILILPCTHIVLCKSCSENCTTCPICRSDIWFRIEFFL